MASEETKLKAKDYKSSVEPIWCPGCGDYGVLGAMLSSFAELGFDSNNTVVVSGIGCSSRFPFFVNTYGIHTAHGRALPAAAGVKLANPKLKVVVTGGDGDGFSIGGGHVPHIARKNTDLTYIMMDNRIYGLTKGQASPTSRTDFISTTTPYGVTEMPVDPVMYTLTYGATFVARGFSGNQKQLKSIMTAALQHKGFAFVDVISPCPTFNKVDTFEVFKDLMADIPEDHDKTNLIKALDLAHNGIDGKMPSGIFYQVERPTLVQRLDEIKKKCKSTDTPNYNAIFDAFRP